MPQHGYFRGSIMSSSEKRNIYTERHFDNDLREDRGKWPAAGSVDRHLS
jgi:hypothetical protein